MLLREFGRGVERCKWRPKGALRRAPAVGLGAADAAWNAAAAAARGMSTLHGAALCSVRGMSTMQLRG